MAVVSVPVTILSDVTCPWSFVGYYLLSSAFSHRQYRFTPSINWVPYLIHHNIPYGGCDLGAYLLKKKGVCSQDLQANEIKLREACSALKLKHNYSQPPKIFDSAKASKLVLWLKNTPYQTPMVELLFKAYFEEHLAIDDQDVLLSLVEALGLNIQAAIKAMCIKDYGIELRAINATWQSRGINETPLFIIGEEFMLSGVQKKSCFFSVLQEVNKKFNAQIPAA